MSGGKKKSGFQITSVTLDFNQTPAGQSAPSGILAVLQSAASSSCSPQGSSSQPTTPSLKRKYLSQHASGQAAGSSSRFRVVRLAVGRAGGGGRSQPYRRGRWTCTDFMERQEEAGFRRVMDTMRHAHSLESLDMIGRDVDRGRVHSQDTAHLLAQPIRGRQGAGLGLRSGPPSPTHQSAPVNTQLEPMGAQRCDSSPPPPSPRPRNILPPLRLDVDAAGRSVLRLSHSQPSSPPAGPNHPTQTAAALSLDRTMFHLPGDASSGKKSSAVPDPPRRPGPLRRPPWTPPLPLRALRLAAKPPEMPVVLRDHRKVKGHVSSGFRESWPTTSGPEPRAGRGSLTPPPWSQPITEARPRPTNQSQPSSSLAARAPPSGRGSEATMMSLLLFCHSSSSNSLITIDNKIEQAMDLVKSHLTLAVREEVELLREQIRDLQEKNQQLERENQILRTHTHTHCTHTHPSS